MNKITTEPSGSIVRGNLLDQGKLG